MFALHPQLESDSFFISDLKISRLLLMNDANYLWLILVPRKPGLVELIDLSFEEQMEVLFEINLLSEILKKNFSADKINIGALGNVVSQLHIHVISRKKNDVTFPKPVWGNAKAKAYAKDEAENLVQEIRKLLEKK
jgi:diadenosine tetraphosphate (Ap4A) HIT family hydrolase